MRRLALVLALLSLAPFGARAWALGLGDKAPDFTLPDQHGKPVHLAAYLGKSNVVLAFYVMAFTPGWTRELKAYQEGTSELGKSDTTVIGISVDDAKTVSEFATALGVTYPLVSDEDKEVSKAYGVLDPSGRLAKRTTFVIDRGGVIRKIDEGFAAVDPAGVVTFCSLQKKK